MKNQKLIKADILLVDDEVNLLKALQRKFSNTYNVQTSDNIERAKKLLKQNDFAAAIIDMSFPGDERAGLKLCEYMKKENIMTKPIVLTAYPSIEVTKQLIRKGDVFAFLEKGKEGDDINQTINDAVLLKEQQLKEIEKIRRLKQFYTNHSAHTFEKTYKTPLKNLCYLLHRAINPYNSKARKVIETIEIFLDLWGNEFSAKIDVPSDLNKHSGLTWIDAFVWQDFKDDIDRFSDYFFQMTYESVNDHFEPLPFEEDYKTITMNDLIQLNYTGGEKESYIMGVRPIFRVILINLLQNAIEAMPWFKLSKEFDLAKKRPLINKFQKTSINFDLIQEENETTLLVSSDSIPMPDESFKKLSQRLDHISKHRTKRDDEHLMQELIQK